MKYTVLAILLLTSLPIFAFEEGLKLSDVVSSGFCTEEIGGKFKFKINGNEVATAYVSPDMCRADMKYKPATKDVTLVKIGDNYFVKDMVFSGNANAKYYVSTTEPEVDAINIKFINEIEEGE